MLYCLYVVLYVRHMYAQSFDAPIGYTDWYGFRQTTRNSLHMVNNAESLLYFFSGECYMLGPKQLFFGALGDPGFLPEKVSDRT